MTPFDHACTPLRTIFGRSLLHCFSFGDHEDENLLCVEVSADAQVPLVRVQSACYTAEIFRSTDCDCHEQLHSSLRQIHGEGGYLVYMLRDGRGAGLLNKVAALAMFENEGVDTHDAYQRLGLNPDPRTYERVALVLRHFEIAALRLLTNNPRKVAGLRDAGLVVERVGLEIEPTSESVAYLETKRTKMGHLLTEPPDQSLK